MRSIVRGGRENKSPLKTGRDLCRDRGSAVGNGPGAGQVPGQQFTDAIDRMIDDFRQYVVQVCLGVESVQRNMSITLRQ
jgi:hypothetical protein